MNGDEEGKANEQINIPLTEMGAPTEGGDVFMPQINEVQQMNQEQRQPLLAQLAGMVAISYLAGTIDTTDQMRFKKMVYRATRGKALTYFRALASDGL